jgi:hypothetical protein
MAAFTLAAWVQLDGSQYSPVFEFSSDESRYGPHLWVTKEGGVYANFWGRPTNDRTVMTAPQMIKLGEWVHVACAYDGQRGTVYVNGIEAGSADFPRLVLETNYPFYVGSRRGWRTNASLQGAIDEALVYDRALTADEIKGLADR